MSRKTDGLATIYIYIYVAGYHAHAVSPIYTIYIHGTILLMIPSTEFTSFVVASRGAVVSSPRRCIGGGVSPRGSRATRNSSPRVDTGRGRSFGVVSFQNDPKTGRVCVLRCPVM